MKTLILALVLISLSGCATMRKSTALMLKGMGDGLKSVPAQSQQNLTCNSNYAGGYNCVGN